MWKCTSQLQKQIRAMCGRQKKFSNKIFQHENVDTWPTWLQHSAKIQNSCRNVKLKCEDFLYHVRMWKSHHVKLECVTKWILSWSETSNFETFLLWKGSCHDVKLRPFKHQTYVITWNSSHHILFFGIFCLKFILPNIAGSIMFSDIPTMHFLHL